MIQQEIAKSVRDRQTPAVAKPVGNLCLPGPDLEPLAIGIKDLARLLGISVATLERWNDSGELGPGGIKKGGRRLWPLAEIKEWVAAGMPRRETWLAERILTQKRR
jgi:predicted DNA-binding transcriptional regulator AlpA